MNHVCETLGLKDELQGCPVGVMAMTYHVAATGTFAVCHLKKKQKQKQNKIKKKGPRGTRDELHS